MMAKTKKKADLTLEERLEQALVPKAEQPYPVPENWCWVYLTRGFAECLDSFRKPINATERANRESDIPYYGATGQVGWIDNYLTNEQLVLLGEDGAPFLDLVKDKAYIIEGKAWVNNHAHILRAYFGSTGNQFLKNYLNIFDYKNHVNGTTRLKLTQGNMNAILIVLPPLAEQKRIVDRIESLFAKLDDAKEKAQAALDSFETRKAAILHKAFTGELTAKWREENGVGMDSWKETTLSNIVSGFKYGTSEKSDYNNSGMPVFRIPNITDDGLSFDDLKYLPHYDVSDESQIHENDILIVRSNGSRDLVGKCVLIPLLNKPCTYASFLIRIRPSQATIPEFLVTYLNSSDARLQMFKKAKSSAGINNINSKELGALTLTLPSIPEQIEIVRILDSFFAKERKAKELCSVLDKIDLIKKSILARAFRGELGTNDPTEESAMELLKSII